MPLPHFEEIYRGHDCCKDYTNPKNNLTIQPYRSVIGPRDSLRLWAKGFHLDCEQNCLSWELISGGGSLQNEYGDENVYYSPAYNAECENNATIALICNGFVTAWAYIAINMWTPTNRPAYMRIHASPDLYLYAPGTATPMKPIASPPSQKKDVRWVERYMATSYLCDAAPYGKYHLVDVTYRWFYNLKTQEWDDNRTVWVLMNDMFNDHCYFSWKHKLGQSQIVDIRSPRMKKAGCCPKTLLPGG